MVCMSKKKHKPHSKTGFTVLESVLYLALAGAIVSGVMVAIGSTIARHRYHDAVQDFAEFLRRQYSEVVNISNSRLSRAESTVCGLLNNTTPGGSASFNGGWWQEDFSGGEYRGRTDCLIYGRMIVIGRSNMGGDIDPLSQVSVFTVVGRDISRDAVIPTTTTAALIQAQIAINNISVNPSPDNPAVPICTYAGNTYETTYTLQWQARTEGIGINAPDGDMRAVILIVRSPINGAVTTYIWQYNPNIPHVDLADVGTPNATIGNSCQGLFDSPGNGVFISSSLDTDNNIALAANPFTTMRDLHMCVGSDDIFRSGSRHRMITVLANGSNSTAVRLVDVDSEENQC